MALFNSALPSVDAYNLTYDTMTDTGQISGLNDPGAYVGNQTGRNVAVSAARALWLNVTPPKSTPSEADPSEHRFTITITAEQE